MSLKRRTFGRLGGAVREQSILDHQRVCLVDAAAEGDDVEMGFGGGGERQRRGGERVFFARQSTYFYSGCAHDPARLNHMRRV